MQGRELFVYFAIVGIYSPRFEMAGHPQRSRHKNNGKMREILQLFIKLMACILCKPHKRKFYCYEIEGECVSCWGFRFWLLLLWCDQRKFCTAADFRKWKRSFGKKLRKRTNYTQGRPHRIRNCRGDSPKISWQITDTNTSFALLGSAYLDCCRATAEDGFFNWF